MNDTHISVNPFVKVPGNNNATYGPVPKAEQIFTIEFLEIVPALMPVDKHTFFWRRGLNAPEHRAAVDNETFTHATVTIDQRLSNEERNPGQPLYTSNDSCAQLPDAMAAGTSWSACTWETGR
ncbi:hypothetical protein DOTSEDRAFT_25396 [Dothistroma septosporum NZE10]|uniref:Uncharacterized protein n=1 Tax=Dothistroma septosporum (strain NZE10 / CBS 128990) TaxID=675120 RepID=M2YNB0_DOTSN|nr:hypothetical protein DOTSEDRAFT_25396 [Dothistroma septosporum NZE10]